MNTFLKNCSIGLIYIAAFIPLYVNNSLFFPFITGKAFAFRIIVEILFALWLILMLRDKSYAPRFSWITVMVTAFVAVIFVTDLAGVNPLRSLWSNFERMEGWVTLIHFWAYYIAASSIFGAGAEGRRGWHNLFRTSLVAAFLVGLYGLFQLFGWAEIHQGSSRIDASLGNAAYMAVYMLGHTFLAWYLALVERSKRRIGLGWMYAVLGLFFAFLLFETATRGTILGLVGGVMLALGLFAVFGKKESKKARFWSGGVIMLIVLLAVGLVSAKNTSFVKNSMTLNRLATISWNENKTQARGYIWPVAVKGVFENPKKAILGWGQENFNYIFNSHYNPKMWSQEQWFDRAHNVFLDWLVAGGLVGFLLYVSLFVFALVSVWKSALSFKEKCLLTGLFVGYAIHNVFVFDNIASYMLFFMLLGFTHSLSAGNPMKWLVRKDSQSENAIVVRDYIFVPVIVILFLVSLYFVNIRPVQANKRLIAAMTACTANSTPSPELYAKALALKQYVANQEIREQLLNCASNVDNSGLSDTVKRSFYELSVKEINAQLAATPNDARAYTLAGVFFNNVSDWESGKTVLDKAIELSPGKQSTIFELAQNYMNSGKEKEAAELLRQAYESAPENTTAQVAYVSALILTGQEAKAKEIAGNNPDILLDPRVIAVYNRLEQYPKVIEAYKALIAKEPTNVQRYASLAGAYFQSGQKSLAIAQLELMKTKFPELKSQLDDAIKQIRESGN